MILVDVNLLVYSWDSASPNHEAARSWLDAKLNETARVGLPWESTLGFVRVVTNPRIFERPATITRAWRQVEAWLSCNNVWIPHASVEHNAVLGGLLRDLGGGPNLIPDAHLAALAIEHGLTLYSSDGDFARFQGLRWSNPLKR
ncbi:MAG: TA system VapC family ribonuclease toxin [Bryobacteraceae bacterium]|jgi:toxin-antitoxin system PIN domain toxin